MSDDPVQGRWLSGRRIGDIMRESGGRPSGFDYLRVCLALLIICFHSVVICYGVQAQTEFNHSFLGAILGPLVPMFFALSGFLVARSLEKANGIAVFLGLRLLRIVPALSAYTLLSAVFLWLTVSTVPAQAYFSDPRLHAYFLNIVGYIHYFLPGVFDGNPSRRVNGQLWTIPYDFECYVVLAGMALLQIPRQRRLFLGLFAGAVIALELRLLVVPGASIIDSRVLLLCFLGGASAYLWRDHVRTNVYLFVLALITMVLCDYEDVLGYLLPLPATYVTVYLGFLNPPRTGFIKTGDYSYGLFLYGYPVQQFLFTKVYFARHWFGHLALAIPCALVMAALSWHLLEKRALGYKPVLYRLQKRWRRGAPVPAVTNSDAS